MMVSTLIHLLKGYRPDAKVVLLYDIHIREITDVVADDTEAPVVAIRGRIGADAEAERSAR